MGMPFCLVKCFVKMPSANAKTCAPAAAPVSYLCKAMDESCKQSNETIEWILQEFRNTPVSSTELLAQDTLENLANQTFESAIKLGSLISTTPVKTVEAWASANVPGLGG